MRPLSQVLNDLIMVAEEALTRPARYQSLARNPRFPPLLQEIRDAEARPSEGVRCTAAGLATALALEAFYSTDVDATSRWLAAIGALLPILRREARQALRNEKEAAGEGYRR